jgi:predicted permease
MSTVSALIGDLRVSVRSLRRWPSQATVIVVILALGLSASIAAFTYVNAFYQPFPGVDAAGLVRVFGVEADDPYQNISYLDYLDYATANRVFEGLAATQPFYAASVRLENMTEVAFLEAVSGSYFGVLDVDVSLGRGISVQDDDPGAEPVAVISHDWWLRSFNGKEQVIGSTIYLNFRPFTVVGVASPGFRGTTASFRPHVWIPIAPFRDRYTGWARRAEDRDVPLVQVYGRLHGGVPRAQALAGLLATAADLDRAYPRQNGSARRVALAAATWIDPSSRIAETPTVRLMLLAAGVLLLLACANVANLLLAVAAGRQRNLSIRAALGASPAQLFRQVLAENMLLSGLAGGVALLLAGPASAWLGSYFARPSVWGENVPREAAIDLRVVAFALAISVVTGVVAGLLPALQAARRNLVDTLKADAHLSAGHLRRLRGRRMPGLHHLLVSTQVGLSVVLLVVAGLVLRTLASVGDLDPGFSYDRLVVTHISTSSTTLEKADREPFFRELAERLGEQPWVRAATVADYPLLSQHPSAELRLEGHTDPVPLVYSKVVPGFFESLGIEVREGRSFVAGDRLGASDVAMVNEALARRFFEGQAAVGRRIWWPSADGTGDRRFEIVGVVRDTRTQDYFTDPEPTVYFSYPQHDYPTGSALLVSTKGDAGAAVPTLHRWLRDFEPHLAIVNVIPYTEVVRGFLYSHRMNAELFSALALLGLALAAVGIFSVMSLAVSRRTREIGIRMSVGARQRDIERMIIGRSLVPVAVGLGVGLIASFALTGLVRGLLHGVEPNDPLTLAAGASVLVLAALSAAFFPARRAASVDPAQALRHD